MATFQTVIDGTQRAIETQTGDYRMVVVMAAAMTGEPLPLIVKVWVNELLPDYGPYWYRVQTDEFGHLVVKSKLSGE